MDGVLCIDKSIGPTSFEVVRAVRRHLGVRKVGHAGTLDPLASGLLVVCVGHATKLVPYLTAGEKRYEVIVALGEETDTLEAGRIAIRRRMGMVFQKPAVLNTTVERNVGFGLKFRA